MNNCGRLVDMSHLSTNIFPDSCSFFCKSILRWKKVEDGGVRLLLRGPPLTWACVDVHSAGHAPPDEFASLCKVTMRSCVYSWHGRQFKRKQLFHLVPNAASSSANTGRQLPTTDNVTVFLLASAGLDVRLATRLRKKDKSWGVFHKKSQSTTHAESSSLAWQQTKKSSNHVGGCILELFKQTLDSIASRRA